jgi:hypothetical protein
LETSVIQDSSISSLSPFNTSIKSHTTLAISNPRIHKNDKKTFNLEIEIKSLHFLFHPICGFASRQEVLLVLKDYFHYLLRFLSSASLSSL